MQIKTISILGCGWFGLPMAKELLTHGYTVKGSTTTNEKLQQLKEADIDAHLIQIDKDTAILNPDFLDTDLLIISIPPKSKSPDSKDYPLKLKAISDRIKNTRLKQVILISSTGIFEDGNFIVDENTIPQPNNDTGKILLAAEELLKAYDTFSTTVLRFAGLIGPGRNLAKHFAGKTAIPNGLAPINLIHLTDCIGITLAIIESQAFGHTFHGVTPDHPTRAAFYTEACLKSKLEKPDFIAEKLNWKQIDSVNVPNLLSYRFIFPYWSTYLEKIEH